MVILIYFAAGFAFAFGLLGVAAGVVATNVAVVPGAFAFAFGLVALLFDNGTGAGLAFFPNRFLINFNILVPPIF
jgi:hypothetical protein